MKKVSCWKDYKLIEVCSYFSDGDWIESKDQSSKGIRLIQTGNIGNGIYIDKTEVAKYISEETFDKLKCSEVYSNDILISRLPKPVGRACIVPDLNERMITAVDCTIVRVNNKICNNKYLLYCLMADNYFKQINLLLAGSTRQRISRNNLGNIEIVLPPLTEQKRITDIIETKFKAVEKAKQAAEEQLKAAKVLTKAYLREVFEFDKLPEGWEWVRLENVCEDIFAGGDVPKQNYSKHCSDDFNVPIYTNGEKNKGLYGYTNIAKVIKPSITISARGTIGYSEMRTETYYPAIRLIVLIPNRNITVLHFLHYMLKFIDFTHNGNSIPQLTVPFVRAIQIPLPPLDEQTRIADILETKQKVVDKTKQLLNQQLSYINALPAAILRKAFNGEL